jgi:hypothetical protein
MWRDLDIDPRRDEPERPDTGRGSSAEDGGRNDRENDPRDAVTRDLNLPDGRTRERIHLHSRTYELDGREIRTLATVGAFRVVPATDLRDGRDHDPERLRHLRDLGLIETRPYVVGTTRTTLANLTDRGRDILEHRRSHDGEPGQRFYTGLSKPRELAHDSQVYRAYLRASERLVDRGGQIRRVVLDNELKSEYQRFLQASNHRRRDSDGRPDRSQDEIAEWARAHQLPMVDEHVQFPDVRIEYDDREGRLAVEDVEVVTPHYRGAHAAAKGRSGFTTYRAAGARLGGGSGGRGGGQGVDPRVAEEFL